jgi:hypothetical protein
MFNHATEEDIKIFPDYCQLDELYKIAIKKVLETQDRSFYFCSGCGGLECIGHSTCYEGLDEEDKQRVDEWKKYIKEIDEKRGIIWKNDAP